MKRKLIQQGGSGLTVYLPKKWADVHGLKPGEEVNVEESGDFLLISAGEAKPKEIELKFADEPLEHVLRAMIRSYCLGFDKITVHAPDGILKKVESDALSHVLGFEVTKRLKGMVVLENISEPSGEKFEVLMRRAFLLIKDMGKHVYEQATKSVGPIDTLQLTQLDKLCYFCMRTLTKNLVSYHRPMVLWELLHWLSAIGYGYYYLSEHLSKARISKQTLEYLSATNAYFDELHCAFYEHNLECLSELYSQRKRMIADVPDRLLVAGKDPSIVWRIQHIARLTRLCANTVFYAIL